MGIRGALEELGWFARDDSFWKRFAVTPPQVVILAPPLDTVPSPQGNAIYVLVERLALLMQIPCVVLAKWPEDGDPDASPASDRILYYRKPLKSGVRDRLPYRLKMSLWGSSAPYLFKYAADAANACNLLNVKAVMIEDIPSFVPVVRSYLKSSSKIILHQHTDAPKSFIKRKWKFIVKNLDGIVFVCEYTRKITEKIHGILNIPATIIYNGVDLAHYNYKTSLNRRRFTRSSLNIPENDFVFLFVGRLIPTKGPAETAEAFNLSGFTNSHLLVVGDFNVKYLRDEGYLNRIFSAKEQSHGRIHLLGNILQENLPDYYAAAEVVVVPSIGSEGFPKVVTEAISMGLPVIASDRGGIWELLKEGVDGFLLSNPESPNCISSVMKDSIVKIMNSNEEKYVGCLDLLSEKIMSYRFTEIIEQIIDDK